MIGYVLTAAVSLFAGAMIGFNVGCRVTHTSLGSLVERRDIFEYVVQNAALEVLAAMRMRIIREEILRVNETRQRTWSP
jgi:hypothetical protein